MSSCLLIYMGNCLYCKHYNVCMYVPKYKSKLTSEEKYEIDCKDFEEVKEQGAKDEKNK